MAFVVVLCETSGRVREAFRRRGHRAVSIDLLPAQDGSPNHIQGDMFEVIARLVADGDVPDLAICHPDCTYLTNAAAWAYTDGPYHQKVKPGTLVGAERRAAREKSIETVTRIDRLPIGKIVIENPVGVLSTRFRKPDQIIQPHWFGDDASKATCLWLRNARKLVPTKRVRGRMVEWPRGSGKMVERWANQTDSGQNRLPPSDTRWQVRSDTYPGIAEAMADQLLQPVCDLFAEAS